MKSVQEMLNDNQNVIKSEYRSQLRTVMNYISNCLGLFGVDLEEFKEIKTPTHYNINEHLEKLLKNRIDKYFDFPRKNYFYDLKNSPGNYQESISEAIQIAKSFLHDNFTDDCYKHLVDKIDEEIETMIELLDKTNQSNILSVERIKNVMQLFQFIIPKDKRKFYFMQVYRSFKRIGESNNNELLTDDERNILNFINLSHQLSLTIKYLKQELFNAICSE